MNESQNEIVNRSLHESLETCNVNEASKCNTTLDRTEEIVNEDFADLTITEKDILEVKQEKAIFFTLQVLGHLIDYYHHMFIST